VNQIRAKQPCWRLDPERYDQLRKQVLQRDGGRCQVCGSGQNLQVHQKHLRSQQGPDDELTLITLCVDCHEEVHRST
jgi:5-methylcytosine-specific restriction endonuclease McrA